MYNKIVLCKEGKVYGENEFWKKNKKVKNK